MRKKVIVANWKMNEDYAGGLALFSEVIRLIKDEVSISKNGQVNRR